MRRENPGWLIAAAVEQEIAGIRAGVQARRTELDGHRNAWEGEWKGEPLLIVRTDVGPAKAREGLTPYLRGHPYLGIVSTGYAGGLREECRLGDILVPREVRSVPPLPEVRLRPDPALREQVLQRIRQGPWRIHTGPMITSDRVVASSTAKRALGLKYDADSVEMESAVIADLASQASIPFVVVRVVLDEVSFSLPDISQVFRLYRKKRFGRLIPHVLLHPRELAGLLTLLRRSRKASRGLDRLFLRHLLDGLAQIGRPPGKTVEDAGLKR
jgi:nucleoside phosphorylase